LKITVSRNITHPLFTQKNGPARRRSGISTFLKHLGICVVLGAITLLIADGGGLIFLAGAIATTTALSLLIKRVFDLGAKLSGR
jgi:hypothetical protein